MQINDKLSAAPSSTALGTQAMITSPPATISSTLNLGTASGAARIIDVASAGFNSNVLEISGRLTNGGLTKQSAGTLTLSGQNCAHVAVWWFGRARWRHVGGKRSECIEPDR